MSRSLEGIAQMDAMRFKQGMRRLASGVSLITTTDGHGRHGFIATSVSSVCAEPIPALSVCVNRAVSSYQVLADAGIFCVNLLQESDVELARRFSSSADRHLRFEGRQWGALRTGAPVLSTALAAFDCKVVFAHSVHTHTIFVGHVVDLKVADDEIDPLLYFNGGYNALRPRVGT